MHHASKRLRTVWLAASVLGCAASMPVVGVQREPVFFAKTNKVAFRVHPLPQQQGSVEMPSRDWQAKPGQGEQLVAFTQRRNEAWVDISLVTLNQPLAFDEITELFADLERERVQEVEPEARDFDTRLFRLADRRVAVVEYTRTGAKGPERVRLYSYPVDQKLFRLTCAAPQNRFTGYEPIFAHMAMSFTPP